MTKNQFIASILAASVTSFAIGVAGGVFATKTVFQNKCDEEIAAMREIYERRMKKDADKAVERYKQPEPEEEVSPRYKPVTDTRVVIDRDYTKYYSRKSAEEKEDTVVDVIENPKPDSNDPPRVVSQDEAMSPDVTCKELEYHIKDEALIDPNTPGQTDLIDEVDAYGMIGNLLRVPDLTKLPNTVYIYNPSYDEYYEIYIYDNFWDPPKTQGSEYEDAPTVEKIRRRRFND